ncbi:MAG: UpxY family transcription antiterminator [Candidatus Sulfotelmatobacter sp.]
MSSGQAVGHSFEAVINAAPLYEPQWYAIRTRSRHEKMVSDQLEKQGIENFLPLIKRNRKWSDRVKEVELPLFAGYNFVRVSFGSPERLQVLKTHGVAGFVGINGCGSAIPENQIHDIRTLLASKFPFEEQPFLKIGQRVRVRGGALDGMEGILSAHNDDRSLVISLEPIERSLSVRIQGYVVEPV